MEKPLVDWDSEETNVFINPLLPSQTKELLLGSISPYREIKGHIWLASSGTENFPKMIALSKQAMLASARAVNDHLHITPKNSWLNVLPLFHTGGLGIHARGFLSNSPVYDFSEEKWDAGQYVKRLEQFNISFSSLTPTHVYDIVSQKLSPPLCLNAIIVGGGAFPLALHEQAYRLGWTLFKSYGMTETCSQIATAIYPTPKAEMVILNHIKLDITQDGFIKIKSNSLLTGYVRGDDPKKEFIDPKVDGWYTTQDKGSIESGVLKVEGRGSSFLKIGGENINLTSLEATWEAVRLEHHCQDDIVIIDMPDERLGKIICLAGSSKGNDNKFDDMIASFNKQVIAIAKIRKFFLVKKIPRTPLGKLIKEELRQAILQQKDN